MKHLQFKVNVDYSPVLEVEFDLPAIVTEDQVAAFTAVALRDIAQGVLDAAIHPTLQVVAPQFVGADDELQP